MKKIINISLLAIAAAAALSCSKEQIAQNAELQIFTAFGPDSKTVLSGTSILWENGDAIRLYAGTSNKPGVDYTTTLSGPASRADFSGTGAVKLENKYYAFYPGSAFPAERGFSSDQLYFNIPTEQIANVGKLPDGTNAMVAGSETTTFQFKHCVAFLKFTIDGTSPAIKSVRFLADSCTVSGTFKVQYQGFSVAPSSLSKDKASLQNYVELKTSDGNAFSAGDYYMSVRGTEYKSGVTFLFISTDGKIASRKIAGKPSLAAGDLMDLGTVKINASEFVDPYSKVSTAYLKGNDKGVIFWVNPANPIEGKIVSGWASSDVIKYVSDATITAFSEKPTCKNEEGNVNIAIIKATDTYKNSIKGDNPAVWAFDECEKEANGFQDGGWYAPSIAELKLIYGAVNGMDYESSKTMTNKTAVTRNQAAYTKFDNALVEAGGKTGAFAGAKYYLWSSNLNDNADKASYVRLNDENAAPKYYTSTNEFNKTCYLRCIKKVVITY